MSSAFHPSHMIDLVADARDCSLSPTGAPSLVLSGDPQTAELIVVEGDGLELGVWEVTPGVFRSTKNGIGEFMTILSGSGSITHADGRVDHLEAGTVIVLSDGADVVWTVTQTIRKVYCIYRTAL